MAQSPNLTHTHTSELILQANALTFDSLNLPITWVNQSWAFFFFFAHLHTHINTTSVGTRIRTAGMCWKVWMLLVIGRSHKMTYLAVIWETARGRKGGRKKKEWGGFDSVCVWEREREAFSWGLSAIIRMNLKTGRRVPINKTSGRQAQFYFLF